MIKLKITVEQARALKRLADAYTELSRVWVSNGGPDDWNGEYGFGGYLEFMGVLPGISLDEAGQSLEHLYQDCLLLLTAYDVIQESFINPSAYEGTDDKYHYYITSRPHKGDLRHRVARNTDPGSYSNRQRNIGDDWQHDELITRAIQKGDKKNA